MGGGEEHRATCVVWIRSTEREGKMKKKEKNGVRTVRIHGPTLFAECPLKTLGKHFLFFICSSLNDLFHVQNKFKLKNCQLQSFITFQDLQLSFWYFLYPMSFMKFEFQISGVQMYFSLRRWFQIKKNSTTRLFNFWRSTTFILVFFIRYSGSNIVHKSYKSHI